MNVTLTHKVVTTRKPHQCFCCNRIFPKGTDMQYWTTICDGGFGSGYNCATCEQLLVEGRAAFIDQEGYEEGCVYEHLEKDQTPEQLLKHVREEKEKQRCLNLEKIKLSQYKSA